MSPFTPDDPAWDALKDRLWNHYHTSGYLGERFVWEGDFYTALDQALLAISPRPIPVSERLPRPYDPSITSPQDCDPQGRCWGIDVSNMWILVNVSRLNRGWLAWLPRWALPLPLEADS